VNLYLSRKGSRYGPYTPETIKEFLDQGTVSLQDLGYDSNAQEWIPLEELIESGFLEGKEAPDENPNDSTNEEEDTGIKVEQDISPYEEDDFPQMDAAETAEKIQDLVKNDQVEFALELIRELEDGKEVCVHLLKGASVCPHRDELKKPEWAGWEDENNVFFYSLLGIVYDEKDSPTSCLVEGVKRINLGYSALSKIPSEIFDILNAEELSIENNRFKKLGPEIGRLKNLRKINLSWNKLKAIPEGLQKLENLQELDLSSNKLKKKSKAWRAILGLKGLKSLNLTSNSLGNPPEDLSGLSRLESLDLSDVALNNDDFKPLLKALSTLPSLTSLTLTSCKISELPDEIVGLSSLRTLNLGENKIEEFPLKLKELPALDNLLLWSNPITEERPSEHHEDFPSFDDEERSWDHPDFSDWKAPPETELDDVSRELLKDFEGCDRGDVENLDRLVDSIIDHEDSNLLVELARGCRLTEEGYLITGRHFPFPKWLDCMITTDDAEDAPDERWKGGPWSPYDERSEAGFSNYGLLRLMAFFPQDDRIHPSLRIKNVRRLYLVLPSRMPFEISFFHEIEELTASRCDLAFLPSCLGQLKKLRELSLDNNNLTELPGSICDLHEMRHLGLSDNSIDYLPEFIGKLKNLRILDVARNRIRELPGSIGDLAKLQFLGLRSNRLHSLPPEIGNLRNLMHLWLGDNRIKELPNQLYLLKSLLALGLVDNPCIVTDHGWLRGVQVTHRPDRIVQMALNAENPEGAEWVLKNVLSWNGS